MIKLYQLYRYLGSESSSEGSDEQERRGRGRGGEVENRKYAVCAVRLMPTIRFCVSQIILILREARTISLERMTELAVGNTD